MELQIVVAYTIGDLVALIRELQEPESAIGDYCLGAAAQVVCAATCEELEQDHVATNQVLVSEIRKLVHPLGVRVKRARFASLVPVKGIKLFGVHPDRATTTQEE